jgi:hypothetical protein
MQAKRRTVLPRAALLLLCLTSEVGAAQADQIITDRPDFVESSNVVGTGRFQVETSVALERSTRDGVRERLVSTPTLLRVGIGDCLELRVETDGRLASRSSTLAGASTLRAEGYADTALGIKWHAFDADGAAPSVGVLAHVDFASGSAPFRAAGRGASLRLVAEWELPHALSLGVMPGLASQRGETGERYVGAIFGVVLGKAWSERLRSFVEVAAPQIAHGRDGGTQASIDVGLAWLLSKDVQIDTAIAHGLNRRSPDLNYTAGLSIKF